MPDRVDDPMLFDFEALWGSDHVKIMTAEQVAVYVRLLSCQWREGRLPADPRLLALRASHGERHVTAADLVGDNGSEPGSLDSPGPGSIWAALYPCYQSDGDEVWNVRVETDRAAWLKKKAGWKAGGEASAEARRKAAEEAPSEAPSQPPSEAPSQGGGPSLSPPDPDPSPNPSEDPPIPPGGGEGPSKAERDFETWWHLMPPKAKTGKAKALDTWSRLPAADRDPDPVVAFLDFLRESRAEVYVSDGGQYLKHGAAFVRARLWEDDPESYPPADANGSRGRSAHRPGAREAQGEELTSTQRYLMRRAHFKFTDLLPVEDQDWDPYRDADHYEEDLRADLADINGDPTLKKQLLADEAEGWGK